MAGNGNGYHKATPLTRAQAAARRRHGKVLPHMLRPQPARSGFKVGRIVLLALAVMLALVPTIGVAGGATYYTQTAAQLRPRLDQIESYRPFQTSRIFDRNGVLLYEFASNGRRDVVKFDQISKYLIDATVSVEDRNFWTNEGVDYYGIARAVFLNLEAGETVSGASTITQQLIKNVVLTEEEKQEGYTRKIKEAVLAQQLTDEYSKEKILELYLNDINYGNLGYGIQAAAQGYFGKDAIDLNLNEASLLAGIPQLPTLYNPIQYLAEGRVLEGVELRKDAWRTPGYRLPANTTITRARQVDVLREMVDNGKVTEAEARAAIVEDLVFVEQQATFNPEAPHFAYYVKQLLEDDPEIGPVLSTEGGLTITTTLDLDMQRIAQAEAKKRIDELVADERNIHNAAVVVMQPGTGQILAMVGSVDYNAVVPTKTPGEEKNVLDGKVNVTTALRQPGSALKPFTYLSAMNQGQLTPGSILWDVETRFPVRDGADDTNLKSCLPEGEFWFCPKNFDQKWHGPLRMREGLANSLNIPAVLALKRAEIGPTRSMLHSMGISGLQRPDDYYGLAMTLGGGEVTPLDLTTAYNTLATDGRYVKANPILKITDRDGTVVRDFAPTPNQQVVDPALVSIVRDFMGDNAARTPLFGRDNPLVLSRPAHVKTGTTDDFRDAWAVGYTPYVTVGVWTGNNNNEKTERVESTQGGGIIWRRIMEAYFADQQIDSFLRGPNKEKPLEFPKPSTYGAVEKKICQIGGAFGKRTTEWFTPSMLEGEASTGTECDLYETLRVVRGFEGELCLPRDGVNYGDQLVSMRVWNLPKSTEGEKILDARFAAGDDEILQGVAPKNTCTEDVVVRPTPVPTAAPTPEADPVAPDDGSQPGAPGAPGAPAEPGTPPAPAVQYVPNLVGLGENQAKAVLAGLGITNVLVDYQGADRLGDAYNQFPAYAVVSHSPGAGTPVQPGMTVVLGVRAP